MVHEAGYNSMEAIERRISVCHKFEASACTESCAALQGLLEKGRFQSSSCFQTNILRTVLALRTSLPLCEWCWGSTVLETVRKELELGPLRNNTCTKHVGFVDITNI